MSTYQPNNQKHLPTLRPWEFSPHSTLPTRLLGAVAATTAAFQSAWKMCELLDVLMFMSIYVF